MWHIEAVKSSKNVVEIGVCYYVFKVYLQNIFHSFWKKLLWQGKDSFPWLPFQQHYKPIHLVHPEAENKPIHHLLRLLLMESVSDLRPQIKHKMFDYFYVVATEVVFSNQKIPFHPFYSNMILHQRELPAQWAVCIFSDQNTFPTVRKQTH